MTTYWLGRWVLQETLVESRALLDEIPELPESVWQTEMRDGSPINDYIDFHSDCWTEAVPGHFKRLRVYHLDDANADD